MMSAITTIGSSGISGTPRHATHAVNAILNYAYSLLAGQLCTLSPPEHLRIEPPGRGIPWPTSNPRPTAASSAAVP